jgi:hypothetical protein
MKTIIAVRNSGGKGKSSTILELANLMMTTFPNHKITYSNKNEKDLTIDFRLVIEINEKKLVFESQGDPGTQLEERLEDIVSKYKPQLIFCTCRTRGETVDAIKKIAAKHTYNEIWTSTYDTTLSNQVVNKIKAVHLYDLVDKLGIL